MSETTLVRVTKKTANSLNELVRKLNPGVPRPGVGNLADKLLAEAVACVNSAEEPLVGAEIQRLRNQLHGLPPPVKFADDPTIAERLATLEKMFTEFTKPKKKAS